MDAETRGAVKLLSTLHDAAHRFIAFGVAQFNAHQLADWTRYTSVGIGVAPMAGVGVSFELDDAADDDDNLPTTVALGVNVWFRDNKFDVIAYALVGRHPEDRRSLLGPHDLPDIRTTDFDECLSGLRDYTARLCACTSVLDELGVPSAPHFPSADA